MQYNWTPSKKFASDLQRVPKIPPVIPAVPYPEEEGVYKESRYYSTATSPVIIDIFIKDYLSFLGDCKEIVYLGRQKEKLRDLALKITRETTTTYEGAKAIHSWVYKNVEYERTPYLIYPWELVKPGVNGDCKSFAVLIASLLGIVNIPCWFKLVKVGDLEVLHIYNLVSLSWEVLDGVGAYPFSEVKPVSGYVIFEVDRTLNWPPKPLPSGGGIPIIPEEWKKFLPLFGLIAGSVGVVSLAIIK